MKKSMFFGALFAAGMLMTACSSENDVVENNLPAGENGGNNYIAISINLPSASNGMTRAGDDNSGQVTFDDGLSAEYAVNDATLIIFDKDTKEFKQAFNLSSSGFTTDDTDKQVTSHGTKIIQMVGSSVVANDLALVILNHNGLFTLEGNSIKFGGTAFTGDFDAFWQKTASTAALNANSMTGAGFFMANAPLVDKQGSTTTAPTGAAIQVLSPIRTLFRTYDEANAGTPDQIYVERGVAKVTMEKTISTSTMKSSKLDGTGALTASVDGWTLDNCNKTSYLVRSTNGHANFINLHSLVSGGVYRYIGNAPITYPVQPTYPYRSYFSKSTNYDGTSDLVTVTGEGDFKTTFGNENPQYCFENTFPVSKQTVKNTTLVQLKVTAKSGGSAQDLYIAGGNKTIVYTETSLKTLIANAVYNHIVAQHFVVDGTGTFSATDITVNLGTFDATAKMNNDITLTYSTTSGADLAAGAFTEGTQGKSGTFTTTVRDAVLAMGDIYKYTGGVSYYNIRIKHFGDILTPWNNGEFKSGYAPKNYTSTDATSVKIDNIYPAADDSRQDNNYLGRYGVLRNNWYNLKVNSINYLGDPIPHSGEWPDTPDDEMENYITFQINILSWAKREQGADL